MKNKKTSHSNNSEDASQYLLNENGNLTKISIFKEENGSIKMSPKSPLTPSKNCKNSFLNKKRTRKNSDLNLVNQSPGISSSKMHSPYTTDTKITSYFAQKKSSSYNRSLFTPDNSFKFTNSAPSTEKRFPFAKKLNFESKVSSQSENSEKKHDELKINNCNFDNFSNFNIFSSANNDNLTNIFMQSKIWNNFNQIEEEGMSEYENLKPNKIDKKLFDRSTKGNLPIISTKTQQILSKIKTKRKNSKTLNLNLQKIIKKINNEKASPQKKDNLIKSIDKILNGYSIKEKYEELLNRELLLPCHYKELFKKFVKLDESLNFFKTGNNMAQNQGIAISQINHFLSSNFEIKFSQEDFQQILFITPHFYMYKWDFTLSENSKEKFEIFLDIPSDIKKRIESTYDDKTNFIQIQTFNFLPMKNPMDGELISRRSNLFKKVLLHLTNEQHKKFLKENGIITKLNPFKHRTWHSEFDVQKVPPVEKLNLIAKPKNAEI